MPQSAALRIQSAASRRIAGQERLQLADSSCAAAAMRSWLASQAAGARELLGASRLTGAAYSSAQRRNRL